MYIFNILYIVFINSENFINIYVMVQMVDRSPIHTSTSILISILNHTASLTPTTNLHYPDIYPTPKSTHIPTPTPTHIPIPTLPLPHTQLW